MRGAEIAPAPGERVALPGVDADMYDRCEVREEVGVGLGVIDVIMGEGLSAEHQQHAIQWINTFRCIDSAHLPFCRINGSHLPLCRINRSRCTHLPAVDADQRILAVRHEAQAAAEVVCISANLQQHAGGGRSIDPASERGTT